MNDQAGMERIGWREWVRLPSLGIPAMKAKIDTGARTSALHAFDLEAFEADGRTRVRFCVHPLQRRTDIVVRCAADVLEQRMVTDSGGHRELRHVIVLPVGLGVGEWEVEFTLTNRDDMLFRMLLGRSALRGRWCVDPGRSFLAGRRRYRYPEEKQGPRRRTAGGEGGAMP